MAKFIEIKTFDGEIVAVNPECVVSMYKVNIPGHEKCKIGLSSGAEIWTSDYPEEFQPMVINYGEGL